MAYRNIRSRQRRIGPIDGVVSVGAEAYDRRRMLVRLLPVGPDEITGEEPESTRRIVLMLARALRIERGRGRAGHWTYDLNRHLGLLQAMKAERERLEAGARQRVVDRVRLT